VKSSAFAAAILLLAATGSAQESTNPHMVLETTEGDIVIELFADKAPRSVENIIQYVEDGFYEDTIFHRIIPGFMVQGGGYGQDLVKKPVREPVVNEADNGLKNDRGTVALARTGEPHSATAQFFVNLIDNDFLDHKAKTPRDWGYAVIGQVVGDGMRVVDRMARTRTRTRNGMKDVPVIPIVITRAYMREPGTPTD
jgi:peptidyl-prolyl cis-trans isomerase B (cyclophilin B)